MTMPGMSRRDLFRYAGAGVGALSLSSILAACGTPAEKKTETKPGGEGTPEWWAARVKEGPGDTIQFTNWPAYIDLAGRDAEGNRIRPSLQAFMDETGIEVTYRADINANEDFYAAIRPALEAGTPTGHDIIVITNGQELTEMMALGYLIELDHSLTPNFNENVGPAFKDPTFDPGNRYTMAWQSGMTGSPGTRSSWKGPSPA